MAAGVACMAVQPLTSARAVGTRLEQGSVATTTDEWGCCSYAHCCDLNLNSRCDKYGVCGVSEAQTLRHHAQKTK
jgi:hypothetical protein